MAKYVRKRADEKELALIKDCKRGITDKKGRPVAAIPQIAYRDGYAYIRIQHWDGGKLNKKNSHMEVCHSSWIQYGTSL